MEVALPLLVLPLLLPLGLVILVPLEPPLAAVDVMEFEGGDAFAADDVGGKFLPAACAQDVAPVLAD